MKKVDFLKKFKAEHYSVNACLRTLIALGFSDEEIKKVVSSNGVKYSDIKDGAISKKVIEPLYNAFKENMKVFAVVEGRKIACKKVHYTTINGTKYYYFVEDSNISAIFDAFFTSGTSKEVSIDKYFTDDACKLAYTDAIACADAIAKDKQIRAEYRKKGSIYAQSEMLRDGLI